MSLLWALNVRVAPTDLGSSAPRSDRLLTRRERQQRRDLTHRGTRARRRPCRRTAPARRSRAASRAGPRGRAVGSVEIAREPRFDQRFLVGDVRRDQRAYLAGERPGGERRAAVGGEPGVGLDDHSRRQVVDLVAVREVGVERQRLLARERSDHVHEFLAGVFELEQLGAVEIRPPPGLALWPVVEAVLARRPLGPPVTDCGGIVDVQIPRDELREVPIARRWEDAESSVEVERYLLVVDVV